MEPDELGHALAKASPQQLLEIQKLLDAQDRLKSPAAFAEWASDGRWKPYPHLALVDEHLMRLHHEDEWDVLIIELHPRSGKSQLISEYGTAWHVCAYPDLWVGLASYESDFAATWGRKARTVVEEKGGEFGIKVSQKSSAAAMWLVAGHQGGMWTAGAGGPITGKGFHLGIIDDPLKGQEQAESTLIRNKQWDWWLTTFLPRRQQYEYRGKKRMAKIIIVQTRWHEDDLSGRLLADPSGLRVGELRLPALAEEEDDPLGRAPGQALAPQLGFDEQFLATFREHATGAAFAAIYQQRPQPEGGGRFKRDTFRYWLPRNDAEGEKFYLLQDPDGGVLVPGKECWRFITVDLAATLGSRADFTVAAIWDVAPWLNPSRLILVHRERVRVEGPEHLPLLHRLQEQYKPAYIGVERATFGLTLIQSAIREGLPVRRLDPDKDKWARAEQAATLLEHGRVYWPNQAPWKHEWESELLTFPSATHDDQVDAFAYAAQEVMRGMNLKRRHRPNEKSRIDRHFDEFGKPKNKSHPILGTV